MSSDWILLPVRSFEDGKRRLADTLSPGDRATLNARLFRHVLSVAVTVFGKSRCAVVTGATAVRDTARTAGILFLEETHAGLNAAVGQGAATLFAAGADRVTVLHCDLPFLAPDDLEAILCSPADIVIAPDTAGTGTNALCMSRHRMIPFCFGTGSRLAHAAAAERRGFTTSIVERRGLAFDIDLPADLALLPA